MWTKVHSPTLQRVQHNSFSTMQNKKGDHFLSMPFSTEEFQGKLFLTQCA